MRKKAGDRFVATRINGMYWMYFGDTNIYAAVSTDLISWSPLIDEEDGDPDRYNFTRVVRPREGRYDSRLCEPGKFNSKCLLVNCRLFAG